MEFRTVKEYERKNRKTNNKLISLPTNTKLKGNDKVVIMTETEYKELVEGIENNKNKQDNKEQLKELNQSLAKAQTEKKELEEQITELTEKLNQSLTNAQTNINHMDLLVGIENTLTEQLQEYKTKLEILESQKTEFNTLSLKYNYLLEEQEEREEKIGILKDKIYNLEQDIQNLNNDKSRLNQAVIYYKHINELLENRGFIDRLFNRHVKTEFKKPTDTDNNDKK